MTFTAKRVLLLGLLAGCTHGAVVATDIRASRHGPEPVEAPAFEQADAAGPNVEQAAAPATPTLVLNAEAWEQGSLLGSAGTQATTRGGIPRLNRMADELRAVAAACDCVTQPVALFVAEDVSGWQVLSALGLLDAAGFNQVDLSHAGTKLRVLLDSWSASTTLLRVLMTGAQLASASEQPATSNLSQLCGGLACQGATLSVTADAPLSLWWQAALRISRGGEAVPIVLDTLPRQPVPIQPHAPSINPVGRIAAEQVSQRVMAAYASLYACLTEFPVSITTQEPLAFELRIAADGTTKSAVVRALAADPRLVSCLSQAFQRMVFTAPNFGSARVIFPFALGE